MQSICAVFPQRWRCQTIFYACWVFPYGVGEGEGWRGRLARAHTIYIPVETLHATSLPLCTQNQSKPFLGRAFVVAFFPARCSKCLWHFEHRAKPMACHPKNISLRHVETPCWRLRNITSPPFFLNPVRANLCVCPTVRANLCVCPTIPIPMP
jgi:hypothetical protein